MQKLTELIQDNMKPVCYENVIEPMQAYSFQEILQYVKQVQAEEILFIRDAFMMNMEVLEEGLQSMSTSLGPKLKKENGGRMLSENDRKTAQLFCGGALEAWISGAKRPVMSLGGSGVCGVITTMPMFAYQQVHSNSISVVQLLYATALSYLVTMHQIREGVKYINGAGVGLACGLCYLQGGDNEQIERARDLMIQYTSYKDGEEVVDKGMALVDIAFMVVEQVMQEVNDR